MKCFIDLVMYTNLVLAILACSGNIEDKILWFRMLHGLYDSLIMLLTIFTNLGGTLSGPIAFLISKDFMILFMSLGLAFGRSKFSKLLKVSFTLLQLDNFYVLKLCS